MAKAPECLHIPVLREDRTADILWESVETPVTYELECTWDESFGQAVAGREWQYLNSEGNSWKTVVEKNLQWTQFRLLDARGRRWSNLAFQNNSWKQHQDKQYAWRDMRRLPVDFTVYRGAGKRFPGPEEGRAWQALHTVGERWQDKDRTWAQFSLLPAIGLSWQDYHGGHITWKKVADGQKSWRETAGQPSRGLAWGDITAHQLNWAGMGQKGLTWKALSLETDRAPHMGHRLTVPKSKKQAGFRVRTVEGGKPSGYLTSSMEPITPLYNRSSSIQLSVVYGEDYPVPIAAKDIAAFEDVDLVITYDPAALRLDPGFPSFSGGDALPQSALPQVMEQSAGRIRLHCKKQIAGNKVWSGLAALLRFRALQTGRTTINLR